MNIYFPPFSYSYFRLNRPLLIFLHPHFYLRPFKSILERLSSNIKLVLESRIPWTVQWRITRPFFDSGQHLGFHLISVHSILIPQHLLSLNFVAMKTTKPVALRRKSAPGARLPNIERNLNSSRPWSISPYRYPSINKISRVIPAAKRFDLIVARSHGDEKPTTERGSIEAVQLAIRMILN